MPGNPFKKEPVTMKHRLTIIALLVAVCAGLYFVNASSHAAPVAPHAWEYKFASNMDQQQANQLGADGWELVAIGIASDGSNPAPHVCVFKRAK
jgi:uncharacterized protein YjeT (DUF2065 family)